MSVNWGQPNTANLTSTLSFEAVRAYGNTSPNVDDMTLQSFSFFYQNTLNAARNVRFALYSGGTLSDVNGATLLAQTAVVEMARSMGAPAWITVAAPPSITIPKNTLIWVVVAFEPVLNHFSTNSADAGDFQSARAGARVETQRNAATVMSSGFPTPLVTTTFATSWLGLYLTYTTPSGPSAAAIHDYLTLNGLTPGV